MRRLALVLVLAAGCSRRSETPQAVYNRASQEYRQGQLDKVLAETRAIHAPDAYWQWRFRLLQVEVLLARGEWKTAASMASAEIPAEPWRAALEPKRHLVLADAFIRLGRLPEATAQLDGAADALRNGGDPQLRIQSEILRGNLAIRSGNIAGAEARYREALDDAVQERDGYYQALALTNLAFTAIQRLRFDAAAQAGERAVAAARTAGARRIEALASQNLGLSYSRLGEYDRALALLNRAADAEREIGDRPHLADTIGEQGNLYTVQSQYARAIAPYQQAFQLARELNNSASAARWAGNLAYAFIFSGQWDQAEQWNRTAFQAAGEADDRRSAVYLRANEARIYLGRKQYGAAEQAFLGVLQAAKDYPELEWDTHAALGALYLQTGAYEKANREFEAALATVSKSWKQVSRAQYKITFLARLTSLHREYIDALVQQGKLEKALQVAESSRAQVLAERLGAAQPIQSSGDVRRFQQFAKQHKAVLLSYWLGQNRSYLWIIRGDGLAMATLPSEGEITSLVTSYRSAIEENLRDPLDLPDSTGRRLYEVLLGPARKYIPEGSRVILIPDGALHRLNMETLPVAGDPPHYWIEDVTLSIAPSLAIITESGVMARRPGPPSILLIGAPQPVAGFPALPKAPQEINSIEHYFPPARTVAFTGAAACPAAYREAQPRRFSLIHFAAHADANRESPLDSSVILSRRGDEYKLYTREVIDQPLTADLVTISGCRSAGVRAYSGEGLIGFAWAFLQAGASSVIAGLWDVTDSSTAAIMDRLYAGIASGHTPVEALRDAKLALIRSHTVYSKPYYWAPFQIYVRRSFF